MQTPTPIQSRPTPERQNLQIPSDTPPGPLDPMSPGPVAQSAVGDTPPPPGPLDPMSPVAQSAAGDTPPPPGPLDPLSPLPRSPPLLSPQLPSPIPMDLDVDTGRNVALDISYQALRTVDEDSLDDATVGDIDIGDGADEVTFKLAGTTEKGKPQLVDSLGYSYVHKVKKTNVTYWR